MSGTVIILYLNKKDTPTGVFFLEKRKSGKWLCFKKGDVEKRLFITKKTFQKLNKMSYWTETKPDDEEDTYLLTNLFNGNGPKMQTKPKELAPFIEETFIPKV